MEGLFSDYEAIRKSGLFDPGHYATAYPDVAERNVDPLVHYLEEGAREGRDPHPDFDTAFYLEQCRARGEEPANPLLHYLLIGAARGFQIKRDGKTPEVTDAPGIVAKPQILVAVEKFVHAGYPVDAAAALLVEVDGLSATVEACALLGRSAGARRFLVGAVTATALAANVAWSPSPMGVKFHTGIWAEALAGEVLSLPVRPGLTRLDLGRIVDAVAEVLSPRSFRLQPLTFPQVVRSLDGSVQPARGIRSLSPSAPLRGAATPPGPP